MLRLFVACLMKHVTISIVDSLLGIAMENLRPITNHQIPWYSLANGLRLPKMQYRDTNQVSRLLVEQSEYVASLLTFALEHNFIAESDIQYVLKAKLASQEQEQRILELLNDSFWPKWLSHLSTLKQEAEQGALKCMSSQSSNLQEYFKIVSNGLNLELGYPDNQIPIGSEYCETFAVRLSVNEFSYTKFNLEQFVGMPELQSAIFEAVSVLMRTQLECPVYEIVDCYSYMQECVDEVFSKEKTISILKEYEAASFSCGYNEDDFINSLSLNEYQLECLQSEFSIEWVIQRANEHLYLDEIESLNKGEHTLESLNEAIKTIEKFTSSTPILIELVQILRFFADNVKQLHSQSSVSVGSDICTSEVYLYGYFPDVEEYTLDDLHQRHMDIGENACVNIEFGNETPLWFHNYFYGYAAKSAMELILQ